jgi:hypothetical protein
MPSIINSDNGAVSGSAALKYSSDGTGVLALQTNGTTAVTVDASQNVGIGIATPVGVLDVTGGGTAAARNWAYIRGGNVGSTNPSVSFNSGIAIAGNFSGGNSETNLVWGAGAGAGQYLAISKWNGTSVTEQMRISSTGAVSIVGTLSTGNPSPTVTVYTSGSGTYTTPANAKYLQIKMVGGGGGGGGSGAVGATSGGAGGNTTFGASLTCTGASGSTAGSATGGDFNLSGANGALGPVGSNNPGGNGGVSPFGGQGVGVWASNAGTSATPNTGSGGGGGGANSVNSFSSQGGGSGGYLEKTIASPLATYSYAVGAGGTAGTAGTGGTAGAAGGSGVIIVTAYY